MSADGRVCPRGFSPAAERRLQEARSEADAVLTEYGAADATGQLLPKELREARAASGLPPVPLRVLVSHGSRFDSKVRPPSPPSVIFSTTHMPERLRAGIARGADLFLFDGDHVDLPRALQILRAEFGVKRVVCGAGGPLFRKLAELGLVDKIRLTLVPVIVGGRTAPTLTGLPGDFLFPLAEFRIASQTVAGQECCLELVPNPCVTTNPSGG
jgi:5-amino-6-(5-phosphoribosylamino)uracil reductase